MKDFQKMQFIDAKKAFEDFDLFFKLITEEKELDLGLDLQANECNGLPYLNIRINDKDLFSDYLTEGKHNLKLKYIIRDETQITLKISMLHKNPRDTKVENGKVVKDKFIIISKFKINNFDILDDYHFFSDNFKYVNNNTQTEEEIKTGFWHNSTLSVDFDLPFVAWYQDNTTKNTLPIDSRTIQKDDTILTQIEFNKLIENVKLLK